MQIEHSLFFPFAISFVAASLIFNGPPTIVEGNYGTFCVSLQPSTIQIETNFTIYFALNLLSAGKMWAMSISISLVASLVLQNLVISMCLTLASSNTQLRAV